jgi:hypothetical protein
VKRPPKAAADAVKRLSPLTLYGKPRFRLAWSEDPKTWAVGKFREESPDGHVSERFEHKQINKYSFDPPCWILEIWEPPEFFGSPEMWARQTLAITEEGQWYHDLGPYPAEGDYRYLLKFIHKVTGKATTPSEKLIEHLFKNRLKVPTRTDLKEERDAKEEAKVAERRKNLDEVVGDVGSYPFAGRPNNLNPKDLLRKLREDRILKEASR